MSQVPKLEIRGAIKVGKAIVEGQQEDAIEEEVSHLDEDFDFLIMPGWAAKDLLQDRPVDAFINIRSMPNITMMKNNSS